MFYRIFTLAFVILVTISSCKSKKKIVDPRKKTKTEKVNPKVISENSNTNTKDKEISYPETVQDYIDAYSTIAKEEMREYGIPASITLAQGILESGAGKGELTRKANNHFGIKCHKGWTGQRVYHDDDEKQECFRKYKDPYNSFRDHSLFLTGRSRYQKLFKLKKDDYKGWAKGLRKAGYATDPKYPSKLISIIERYDLEQFDREVLKKKRRSKEESKKVTSYTVQSGDTLFSIARRFGSTVDSLKEYNGLQSDSISAGQVLYLQSDKKD